MVGTPEAMAGVAAGASGGGLEFDEVVVIVAVGVVDEVVGTDDVVLEAVGATVVIADAIGGATSGTAAVVGVRTVVVGVDVAGGVIDGGCGVEDGFVVGAALLVFSARC
jgi:hypothetical protein